GDGPTQLLLVAQSTLDGPLVGAEHDKVLRGDVQAADVVIDDGAGEEVIDRDVEKALDLGRVQVEGQDAVGSRNGQDVGDQLGGDRHPAHVLAVLPGVPVIGEHHRDPGRAAALQAVEDDEELHDVVVHRVAGRLHHENISAPHVLVDPGQELAVG